MNQIMEQIASEKIAEQAQVIEQLRGLVVCLVWKIGQGKQVSIPKGVVREASTRVESLDYRQLSSGELRITLKLKEKENGTST